jgi:hypothetical protein
MSMGVATPGPSTTWVVSDWNFRFSCASVGQLRRNSTTSGLTHRYPVPRGISTSGQGQFVSEHRKTAD